ncbi:MAG: flagellar basal body P-ring formation chaperone FlgA [Ignavibacteria bacterium]|nr:flagellar basal body P-ring formation chaperone FlgA [Ignavibacteria bacterium]
MKYLLIIMFSVQLLSQSFEDKALQFLQKEFPEYEKIEMQLQNKFLSDEKITIDNTRNINLGKGVAYIPVIVTKGKKTSSSVLSVKVELFKKLLLANKDFGKKELLLKSGFEEKVINVTRLNGNPVKSDFVVSDYRSKSFIKKGEILFAEKMEKIPLINSGDKVFAEVRSGNVMVTTEAFARQQGSVGDLIEIVSKNNKIIKARIVNVNKVIVE